MTIASYSVAIRELPNDERPRERLARYGPQAVSAPELLAIVLRTGTVNQSVLSLADHLIHAHGGLRGLATADLAELTRTKGVGKVKAIEIAACFELGKRLLAHQEPPRSELSSPEAVANLLMPEMRDLQVEEFRALMLDTKSRLMRAVVVSRGTLDASLVHPREVFRAAIACSAANVVVAHNHPTGDPTPSQEDRDVTRNLIEAGKVVGVELLDHVIIGNSTWVSLMREGLP